MCGGAKTHVNHKAGQYFSIMANQHGRASPAPTIFGPQILPGRSSAPSTPSNEGKSTKLHGQQIEFLQSWTWSSRGPIRAVPHPPIPMPS